MFWKATTQKCHFFFFIYIYIYICLARGNRGIKITSLNPVGYMQPYRYIYDNRQTSVDFLLPLAVTQLRENYPVSIFKAQIRWCQAALLPPLPLTRLAPWSLSNQWPSQLSPLVCSVSIWGTGKDRRKEVFSSSFSPLLRYGGHQHCGFSCSAGADFYQ